MDGRSRRAEFVGSPSRSFGNSNPENQAAQGQPRNLHPSLQSSSSAHNATKFRTSSLATPYGTVPGLLFDPVLYSSIQRPYLMPQIHPGLPLQTGYQPTMTGLNQINPVLLLSSNDNNNCNSRSRAASHSSVLEMHQHRTLGVPYPIVPGAPYPYYVPEVRPNLLPNAVSFRRNSTNTSLPHDGAPLTSHGAQDRNLPPPYDRPPPPYPTVANASGLVQNSAFHPLNRRERYSIGGPLTTSDMSSRNNALLRRNSIPTSLEVQPISEESTENSSSVDDDDDDVFELSPPLTAPHSATDAASFLEQLRESRKRASTSGEGPSQSKYPCSSELLRRPRFRRCDGDHDANEKNKNKKDEKTQPDDAPGTSQQAQMERCSNNDANTGGDVAMETAPIKRNQLRQSSPKPMNRKSATPSPSILKNPKIPKINRSGLKQSTISETQNCHLKGQSSNSAPDGSRIKSLPIKKQVAWKDRPEINHLEHDVIMPPIKHDMLSEQCLTQIVKRPDDFTEKYRMGPFIFGPKLGTSPVRSISQYLVRKAGTFKYYLAKVLLMGGNTNDDKSGRLLLYSEHSLLTLLKNHPGVVREHGLYKDVAFDRKTGKARERVCLVLDCLAPHEFDPETKDYLVLQKYVMKVGHLVEWETIKIFTMILNIVHSLHELNVVHRDLKLENMVLLEKSQKIILTNFCLGRHLMSDGDLLKDRRGSPAYISPDVLSGKPYAGKPSDMWSLGVVLFMMLYGQFPFYDKDPTQLFKKIRKADFTIPSKFNTSMQINDIIVGLLTPDPATRLTSGETLVALQKYISARSLNRYSLKEVQVVPDIDNEKESSSEPEDEKNDDLDNEEERLTKEFRLKLLSDDEDATPSLSRTKAFARTSYQSTLPTSQHCPYDARPLTQEEIAMHHRLLVNSTLGIRVQGSS